MFRVCLRGCKLGLCQLEWQRGTKQWCACDTVTPVGISELADASNFAQRPRRGRSACEASTLQKDKSKNAPHHGEVGQSMVITLGLWQLGCVSTYLALCGNWMQLANLLSNQSLSSNAFVKVRTSEAEQAVSIVMLAPWVGRCW